MTRRAMRRYRRAFLESDRRNTFAVATHLRDSLPFFVEGDAPVCASGVYLSGGLSPDNPVREAVAALGGAEFWVEDCRGPGEFIHSVYVVTVPRAVYLARGGGKSPEDTVAPASGDA